MHATRYLKGKTCKSASDLIVSIVVLLALSLLANCGGGDAAVVGGTEPAMNVETSLNELGVRTTVTPRLDSEGNIYPDSFAPFGPRIALTEVLDDEGNIKEVAFGRTSEILFMGFQIEGKSPIISVIDHLVVPEDTNVVDPILLFELEAIEAPWAREELPQGKPPSETLRDAAAADVDGDGLEELAFVYLDEGTGELHLLVISLDEPDVADLDLVVPVPPAIFPISDIRVVAADFDHDGGEELAVAVARSGQGIFSEANVLILEDATQGFALMQVLSFPGSLGDSSISLVLEPGGIDYDGSSELVVVINELVGSSVPSEASTRYHVFDDANTGFVELTSGPVSTTVNGTTHVALVADVSVGDLDDDQAGEIVFAGLTEISQTCESVEHLLIVLDDALHGLGQLDNSVSFVTSPQDCGDFDPWLLRFVHVNTLDVDGDDDLEIQVNRFIFQTVPDPGVSWDNLPEALRMNETVLLPQGSNPGLVFDRSTATMAVADVNGDGRDDVMSYRQGNPEVEVYGLSLTDQFTRIARVPIEFDNPVTPINPIVIPVDPDIDGQILEYIGDYQLVFTEPLIIAALAAPPCGTGIGQNIDACTTTWGRFESVGVEGALEQKFSAGFAVGFNIEGGVITQSEIEAKVKFSLAMSRRASASYQLTKSESFTTGPLEDSVVFFSIPYDVYTYRVIAHPDPEREGTEIIMGLPRDPVVRLAERTYYNNNIPEGSFQVGENVFQHTPGVVDSYLTFFEKDQVLVKMQNGLDEIRRKVAQTLELVPVFEPLAALLGLETNVLGVGQGGGSTEVALELSSENSFGLSLERGVEFEAETTAATVKLGMTVGFSETWTTNLTFGRGTTYVGTVGSIDGDHFAAEQYQFGLFTYLQGDPDTGKEFQVVNYWVEK